MANRKIDFLRLSRASIDDSISLHLNAAIQGSKFDPIALEKRGKPLSRRPDSHGCSEIRTLVYTAWDTREQILDYCQNIVETSSNEIDSAQQKSTNSSPGVEKKVSDNGRLDPYYNSTGLLPNNQQDQLKRILDSERITESIVRDRTWRVFEDRCGNEGLSSDWKTDYDTWKQSK